MQNRLSISNEIRSIKSKFDYSNYAPIPTTTTTIATTTANEDEQGNALDETTNADETANADETTNADETATTTTTIATTTTTTIPVIDLDPTKGCYCVGGSSLGFSDEEYKTFVAVVGSKRREEMGTEFLEPFYLRIMVNVIARL